MAVESAVAQLLRGALENIEPFLESMVRKLRSEVPGYATAEGYTDDEIRFVLQAYLGDVSDELQGATPAHPHIIEELMRRRAEAGLPLAVMLHSYRVGIALLWEALAQMARDNPEGKDALIAATPTIFSVLDRYSQLASRIHHEIAIRNTARSEQMRATMIDIVFSDVGAGAPFWNAIAALQIPRTAPFVVIETTDKLDIETYISSCVSVQATWFRVLPDAQIGIVALRSESPNASINSLVEQLSRESIACGVSSPFGSIADAAKARTQAHVAVSATTRNRPVVRYDGDILSVLLASAPEAAQTIVARTLGPILELPDQQRNDLLETTRAWIRNGKSVAATAAALHCHRNTINYRLRRFREITGQEFSDNAFMAQLVLALEADEQSR